MINSNFFFFHYSGNCSNQPADIPEPVKPTPATREMFTQQLFERIREPYLGAVLDENKKLWSNDGLMGRLMSPLEDTYLEFLKHHESMPQIQDIRVLT